MRRITRGGGGGGGGGRGFSQRGTSRFYSTSAAPTSNTKAARDGVRGARGGGGDMQQVGGRGGGRAGGAGVVDEREFIRDLELARKRRNIKFYNRLMTKYARLHAPLFCQQVSLPISTISVFVYICIICSITLLAPDTSII
jgi:hypothetical protein